MAFDSNAFTADLLKDVQVDDATKTALLALVQNPVVQKRLEESTLRQSDYSKKVSELKSNLEQSKEYYDSLVQWKADAQKNLEQEKATLRKQLADNGIDVGLNDDPSAKTITGVTREELNQLAQESLAYQNSITKIAMNHYKEFGEVLDTDELLATARKDRLTDVNIAYQRMVQPKREEIQKAEVAKLIEKAREDGKAEALKNVKIPSEAMPLNNTGIPHSLDKFNKTEGAPSYGAVAAVQAFKEARLKSA